MESKYQNHLGRKHQFIRLFWSITWCLCARWLPRSIGSGWKRFLLRCFGAKIHPTAIVYSSAKIYYPANLSMDEYACIASDVDCYNVAHIHIGKFATVSQGAFLCAASHDITSPTHDLITGSIVIEDQAWIGAGAFISINVTIHEGVVVGARSAVFKDVEAWTVVGGNPAKFIKKRVIKNA